VYKLEEILLSKENLGIKDDFIEVDYNILKKTKSNNPHLIFGKIVIYS
jgi:hypothetical protein